MYRLPNPLTEDSVRKLLLDPRYQDARRPEHRGFTDFVTSAFQALYPEPEKRFIRIGARTAEPDTIIPDVPAEQLDQWNKLAVRKSAEGGNRNPAAVDEAHGPLRVDIPGRETGNAGEVRDDQAERQGQDIAGARAKMAAQMRDAQDDAIRRAGRGLSASGSLGFDPEAAKDSDKPMGDETATDRVKSLETMGLKNVPPLPHVIKSVNDAKAALKENPDDYEAREALRQAAPHLRHYIENAELPLDIIEGLGAIANPGTAFTAHKLKEKLREMAVEALVDRITDGATEEILRKELGLDKPKRPQWTSPRFGADRFGDSFGAVMDTDIGRAAYERTSGNSGKNRR